jgi:hypothetical protein
VSEVQNVKSDLAKRLPGTRSTQKITISNSDTPNESNKRNVVRRSKRPSDHPGITETHAMLNLAKENGMDGDGFFVPQKKIGHGRAQTEDGRDMSTSALMTILA